MWKEREGQFVTYIGTFGARETHNTRLPTSTLRTWRSRATVFTRGSLKERTSFSEQTLQPHSSTLYLVRAYCCRYRARHRHTQHVGLTRGVTSSSCHTHGPHQ